MRALGLLLLIACSTSRTSSVGEIDAPSPSCPATAEAANGTACDGNLACTYAESAARNLYCTCQVGRLWCSDCDPTQYGFGTCSPGEGCSYSSWETDCDCTCTARGTWNCTSGDAQSPCPRDPGA